ncbi:TPA: type IV toxin-antitoxin system AbiEi family antitoxin domain-containing protein [Pseudomonas aeruginosa]|uniref:DUF6088 family protein n=1 Tax=Stutzerimonas stutzeri TaxID=316 RepID=UPI001C48892E|nr:DUF6088 family protein [Stutzerimonas stutzeri]HEJ5073028.1 type IV toxin-antitoxin system AbiEi family antitoxin domain-containing protein [Pseudomonas aeruginosa]HEJ5706183.1 type IV toxin-antitoxin system AbiEi family antitoxin domain-containing protein [Pseudomonas aeruginosa]
MSRHLSESPVSQLVLQRVMRLRKGRPFSIRDFAEFGTSRAISKAVAQLVRRGELERVCRGIYMRPKRSQYTGRVLHASPLDLVSLLAKQNRWTLQIHGADAVRKFGLSTQMPVIPIYYTSGPSRSLFVGEAEIRLVHAAPMVMQCTGTKVGMAISALFYLGKSGTTPEHVAVVKKALSPEEMNKLLACKIPKWMRAALETT